MVCTLAELFIQCPAMAKSVTEFTEYMPDLFPRYTIKEQSHEVVDTKWRRAVVANRKRGGSSYYRMVDKENIARHVLASTIFGDGVDEDLMCESEFDPVDFSLRYDFDVDRGLVFRLPGRGPKSGEQMTLLDSNGWEHYVLTHNDGHRVYVTPAEIMNHNGKDHYTVPPPTNSRSFPQFPGLAFLPDGKVVRTESDTFLNRPTPVLPAQVNGTIVFELRSNSGQVHRITSDSIRKLFTS